MVKLLLQSLLNKNKKDRFDRSCSKIRPLMHGADELTERKVRSERGAEVICFLVVRNPADIYLMGKQFQMSEFLRYLYQL